MEKLHNWDNDVDKKATTKYSVKYQKYNTTDVVLRSPSESETCELLRNCHIRHFPVLYHSTKETMACFMCFCSKSMIVAVFHAKDNSASAIRYNLVVDTDSYNLCELANIV